MKTDDFEVKTNVFETTILRHTSVTNVQSSDVCHTSTTEPHKIHVALRSSKWRFRCHVFLLLWWCGLCVIFKTFVFSMFWGILVKTAQQTHVIYYMNTLASVGKNLYSLILTHTHAHTQTHNKTKGLNTSSNKLRGSHLI